VNSDKEGGISRLPRLNDYPRDSTGHFSAIRFPPENGLVIFNQALICRHPIAAAARHPNPGRQQQKIQLASCPLRLFSEFGDFRSFVAILRLVWL